MLRPYYYAGIYALSVMVFIATVQPTLWADYMRGLGLSLAVVVILWVVMAARLYTYRYQALPPERRGRMMAPRYIWAMGAAFLLAVSDNIVRVIDLLGGPLQTNGLPMLMVTLTASAYWLWPLVRHQRVQGRIEREVISR